LSYDYQAEKTLSPHKNTAEERKTPKRRENGSARDLSRGLFELNAQQVSLCLSFLLCLLLDMGMNWDGLGCVWQGRRRLVLRPLRVGFGWFAGEHEFHSLAYEPGYGYIMGFSDTFKG
jgi:hypothetical protein